MGKSFYLYGEAKMPRASFIVSVCLLALASGGCSPTLQMGGAYFPGWLLSAAGGMVLTSIVRAVLIRLGLDLVLEPRLLTYPAMAVFFTLSLYLLFFT